MLKRSRMLRTDIKQRTPEWYALRRGKVSGTAMKGVMGGADARQTALYEVVAGMFTVDGQDPDKPEYENDMSRGTRLEPRAVAEYEFATGLVTEEVGFVENDTMPLSGMSPDRYIKGDVTHALEIKCLGGGKHMRAVVLKEVPKEHHPQCIKYFIDNAALQTLDVVLYNPDIPRFALHVITLKRADVLKDIEEATIRLTSFIEDVHMVVERIAPF